MNHFQPHMMPQPNQQPSPRSQGIHPRFPPSNQVSTPMQQTSVPQPNTFNQNEQRPWRQGTHFQKFRWTCGPNWKTPVPGFLIQIFEK